jgi:hypothetical protein
MRKLKIDLTELAMAFEDDSPEVSYYLDPATGRIICIDEQMLSEPEEAEDIEAGLNTDLISVPHDDVSEGYRDMESFIATVEDKRLQNHLWEAIEGRGAFRRFKDVLAQHFHERERWFTFRDTKVEERLRAWLEIEEIELIEDPEEKTKKEQRKADELADIRLKLIAEVLAFVRAARKLPGVTRIALIGSLTTDRADPKDADLLLTVTDDADLTLLARCARRLQGRAQGFNRGGDVFLMNAQGTYLGRTCPWKECAPGIRQSCNALHCGLRHYLHDDLQTLTLPQAVISEPALELWPQMTARAPVPEDVKAGLISELQVDNP